MAVRVSILIDPTCLRRLILLDALQTCLLNTEMQVLNTSVVRKSRGTEHFQTAPTSAAAQATRWPPKSNTWSHTLRKTLAGVTRRLPASVLCQLIHGRPHLVITEGFGLATLQAALYRTLIPQSRLLVLASEPPRSVSMREQMILARADGLLTDGKVVAKTYADRLFPCQRIFSLASLYTASDLPAGEGARTDAAANRLVYADDLSPEGGAADFLMALALWAEQHPEHPVEIWWVGEGDLAGLLDAQPLPATVSQRFLGALAPASMAAVFEQCSIFVAPALADCRRSSVVEALASGLPVLGSLHDQRVRQLIDDGANGWIFDPLRPGGIVHALDRALSNSVEAIEGMREEARRSVSPQSPQHYAEIVRKACASVMPSTSISPTVVLDVYPIRQPTELEEV